jgi:MFS family permease
VPPGIADPAFLVGAPISLFMLVGAFTMAFGALWSDTAGRRRTFATGAIISTIGLVGTALAGSFVELLVWRALSGMGYGLTFVACQGYVIDRTTPANRAQGVSMFVGGVLAADICGPAVGGGILADRIGFEATFLIGAGVAALAGVLVFRLMDAGPPTWVRAESRPSIRAGLAGALGNWRFVALILLAGMPSKLILTGVLFYLVPLQLTALGSTQPEIGRIAMAYGIAALLLTPIFALIADRSQAHGAMVGLGGIVSGIGMLPVLFAEDAGSVFVAVLLLGLGQAMSLSSLLTFAARVAHAEIARLGQAPVLGTFRLFERIGSALGPFVVAAFVVDFGYAGAMALAGVVAIATAVVFSTVFLIAGMEPEPAFAEMPPIDRRDRAVTTAD